MTRVAITTDRFSDVALEYRLGGLVPVAAPCIRFEPAPSAVIDEARSEIAAAELALLTSPRAVDLLWPDANMPDVPVAAVGHVTAAAVAAAGGRVELVGDAGLSRLIDLVSDALPSRKVVIAHAAGADPEALARLVDLGPEVTEHVIYRVVPVGPPTLPVDVVSFASPSAVNGWCLTRTLDDVIVGVIGSTTARAVALRREPDVIAEQPSHPALARAIAAFTGAAV